MHIHTHSVPTTSDRAMKRLGFTHCTSVTKTDLQRNLSILLLMTRQLAPKSWHSSPRGSRVATQGCWTYTLGAMSTYITEVISTFSAVLFPDACPSVSNLNNVNSAHNSKPQLTHKAGCPQRREQSGRNSAGHPQSELDCPHQ